ncbi:hypothetical protein WKR88_00160 [Trinickia caryophylli]|uniref:Uncharacterized protein n=1 Tax=Trinickia caryophylli TaxID=28094 RepID=A0A1X7D065_TRICW|nr:hypothetical protein [Trinickia caryophylli]WQE15180.1 hypothetical protein U0034_21770 [Trinickia caryophylli]GLU31079.1 hypothetical protein Busp01_09210 [Trinickia caryophylli]SMF06200.1 hypothetical protein SAMN06295900_102204 [Trinickia caryophylli]
MEKSYSKDDEFQSREKLVEVKKRLHEGKLSAEDIQQLEAIVRATERAASALRAAVVE